MLEPEQRSALVSYERPCQAQEDCHPPLVCFLDRRSFTRHCTDSTCVTDQHCAEGFVCRMQSAGDGALRVRTCTPVGKRQEGEECDAMPRSPEGGCAPGLVCQGWCGRSCRIDDVKSCLEGFSCHEGPDGPSCLPTCEGRACPEGQRCIQRNSRVSVCAVVHGEDCQRSPCAPGERCRVFDTWRRPGEVWMQCSRPCDEDTVTCPEGYGCFLSECSKACDPATPEACGPYFKCHQVPALVPWVCGPDMGSPSKKEKPSN